MAGLTPEIFAIPVERGRYLVYSPSHQTAFVATAALVNLLADLQQGVPDDSDHGGGPLGRIVEQLGILDADSQPTPPCLSPQSSAPTSAHLILSTQSATRCAHCEAGGVWEAASPARTMDLATAVCGIDQVAANAAECPAAGFSITYHGGEYSSQAWSVQVESLAYARERAAQLGLELRASSTALEPFNSQQTDWIRTNLDDATLVLVELPPGIANEDDPDPGQCFDEAWLSVLRRFRESRFPYQLQLRVSVRQLPRLPEAVRLLCGKFATSEIQVEPAFAMGQWTGAPSADATEFLSVFRQAKGIAANFDCFLFVAGARLGHAPNFCGFEHDEYVLLPNGEAATCCEGATESCPSTATRDALALATLRGQAVRERDYCKACFAKSTCAGECYGNQLARNSPAEFAGSNRCHVIRELTKDELLAAIADADGIAWKGNLREPEPAMEVVHK